MASHDGSYGGNGVFKQSLEELGIELRLMTDKAGDQKPINVGYVLGENERAFAYARVPSMISVSGCDDRDETIHPLEPDGWIGDTPFYLSRILVFEAGDKALIMIVGKDKVTCKVWRSLRYYDPDDWSRQGGQVGTHPPKEETSVDEPSEIKDDASARRTKTMSDIGTKIKAAKEYRTRLEATVSGVLLCRKEELRLAFGGQKLKVKVSRDIEAFLGSESILTYPPLHQEAKDLVLLALKDAGCLKSHPELFAGDDPYEIAQRVMEQGFKGSRA